VRGGRIAKEHGLTISDSLSPPIHNLPIRKRPGARDGNRRPIAKGERLAELSVLSSRAFDEPRGEKPTKSRGVWDPATHGTASKKEKLLLDRETAAGSSKRLLEKTKEKKEGAVLRTHRDWPRKLGSKKVSKQTKRMIWLDNSRGERKVGRIG